MKGSVIRRGPNKWSVVIDLGKDPVTGVRRRKWHSGFALKKDAERARVEILNRLQTGEYVEPSKQVLGRFLLETWLPARKSNLSPTTFSNYETQVRAYIIPYLGSRPLQALTPGELNVFYSKLLDAGQRQGRGGLGAKSVRNIHGVLRRALEDAVRWNHMTRNPAAMAEPPRAKRRNMNTWQPAEVRAFLAHQQEDRLFALWLLAATTGLRRGEVLGLDWDAVKFEAQRLEVDQTLVVVDGKPVIRSEAKTASSRRSVELDAQTVRALRSHKASQNQERLLASSAWQNARDLVFTDEIGQPIKPQWLTRTFGRRVVAAGLPPIRFHDLRHGWASIAMAAGVHPKIVSSRLGHSNISMTLDTYSHVVPSMDKEAAETVAALIL